MELRPENLDLWKQYVEGNTWKCEKSPTKAHHWQEQKQDEKKDDSVFVCKFCAEERKMCTTWSGALANMAKKLNKHTAISPDSF